MFAPKVAKTGTKASASPTNRLEPHRSVLAARPLGSGAIEQAHMLQRSIGNHATLRLLAQRGFSPTTETAEQVIGPSATARAEPKAPAVVPSTVQTRTIAGQGVDELDSGAPLDLSVRARMKSGFGQDFSGQRSAPRIQTKLRVGNPYDTFEREANHSLQTKLKVNTTGDMYEREADHVAEQVMRAADRSRRQANAGARLQRCACGGTCASCREENEKMLQRSANAGGSAPDTAPPVVEQVLRSPGEPMDPGTRQFMETGFGVDFGGVRVHRDGLAAEAAQSVSARAFTVGRDVVFAPGEYSPCSECGRSLLAHELTHVLQQGGAPGLASAPAAMLQRDTPGVHSGPPAGMPLEKWGESVEGAYRRAGLWEEANAVKRCREGDCAKVLTDDEAYHAYRTGRIENGLGEPEERKPVPGRAEPGVPATAGLALGTVAAPALRSAGQAATKTALERAAAAWGEAALVPEAGAVVETGTAAAPAAAGAATIAVPIALGVYVVVAIADLFFYGSFLSKLRKLGYVILPAPLQVCISGCHYPAAPTFEPSKPFLEPLQPLPLGPFDLTDKQKEDLTKWLNQQPTRAPTPTPVPVPKPKPKEKEDQRRDCVRTPRLVPRGGDPLSALFCESVGFGCNSVDIWSRMGSAEIDCLVPPNLWYECKCGHLSLLRAFRRRYYWAIAAMVRTDEEILRHQRIAAHCGLAYRVAVANEEVAAFFRDRYPGLDVLVVPWEPCEV